MTRFEEKKRRGFFWPGAVISVLLVILLALGAQRLDAMQERQRIETLEETVRRMASHCYAAEGFYPPDLSYLEEHYGLMVDHAHYLVDYTCFASNLAPEVAVVRRTDG